MSKSQFPLPLPASEDLFPSPLLLQRLTRGTFCQHGLRSLRLWVWLRGFYGRPPWLEDEGQLYPRLFKYAEWRDRFFTPGHPTGEGVPTLHDPHCPCSRSTQEWLLADIPESQFPDWVEQVATELGVEMRMLQGWLQQRLFGVTRRTLAGDLELLVELELLQRRGRKFLPYPRLPEWIKGVAAEGRALREQRQGMWALERDRLFANLDLGTLAQRYAEPVAGTQRFFLEVDYVVRDSRIDLVEDCQEQLYQFWRQSPVPPVAVTYHSARVQATVRCVVFPVCCYYVRRSIYLCGFGQTPTGEGEWYNFRLDRIGNLQALNWEDGEIPFFVYDAYRQKSLPTPAEIRHEMEFAWGFDFYLEPRLMVLRFDPEFHEGYVAGTFRHETFRRISYEEVRGYVQQCEDADVRSALEAMLDRRSPDDPYYRAVYRHLDTNVRMRLRAWRPFGEVILPWSLRQEMAQEVREEFGWYWG